MVKMGSKKFGREERLATDIEAPKLCKGSVATIFILVHRRHFYFSAFGLHQAVFIPPSIL